LSEFTLSKLDLQNKTAIALLQTANKISADIAGALAPLDLSMAQLKILWIIAQSPDKKVTVNQIKEQMLDPASNVSRLLNKLMDKAYIIKHRDSVDQRVVYISTTEQGITQMCAGKTIMDDTFEQFNTLSQCEMRTLIDTLSKL